MKIIKINSCMDCPKYVDDEVGWCEITRAVAPLEGLPMWCPLEEVHDTRTNEKCNKCPKCGSRLSFGLSGDKWVCTVCGLMSRDYYANTGED